MRIEDYELLYRLENTFWWFVGMRKIAAALLDPFCPRAGFPRRVLDVGCGTGANLSWLQRYAGTGTVTGIDSADAAIHFCQTRNHQAVAKASATELPFRDSGFDLVTSFDVLGQLPGAGDREALREIYRVLRPGGLVLIRVAAYEWMRSSHDDTLGTVRRYELKSLTALMTEAGFRPLRSTYANSLLFPAAAIRRLLLKRIGLAAAGSDVQPLPPRLQWLNGLLTRLLALEATWLKPPHRKLSGGLSVICLAAKPTAAKGAPGIGVNPESSLSPQ
jgi:ubiquinone/menaquinone biosynthesis C-methylase UbiE